MSVLFPDVPIAPGVPAVLRAVGAVIPAPLALLTADLVSIAGLFGGPQWGIFDAGGAPFLIGDSVHAVDYRREWAIADYPMEQGAFESYNKVARPFDCAVIINKSTDAAGRAAFLDAAEAACASLNLYSVVTPEISYASANLVGLGYRRVAEGSSMLTVEIRVREVRITATQQFTKTKTPNGADPQNQGTVQSVESSAGPAEGLGGLY